MKSYEMKNSDFIFIFMIYLNNLNFLRLNPNLFNIMIFFVFLVH